jgi:hypothetical protein
MTEYRLFAEAYNDSSNRVLLMVTWDQERASEVMRNLNETGFLANIVMQEVEMPKQQLYPA